MEICICSHRIDAHAYWEFYMVCEVPGCTCPDYLKDPEA